MDLGKRDLINMVDADENESLKPGLNIEKLFHCDLHNFFKTTELLDICVKANKEWTTYCDYLKSRFTSFEGIKNENNRVCCYSFWKVCVRCRFCNYAAYQRRIAFSLAALSDGYSAAAGEYLSCGSCTIAFCAWNLPPANLSAL